MSDPKSAKKAAKKAAAAAEAAAHVDTGLHLKPEETKPIDTKDWPLLLKVRRNALRMPHAGAPRKPAQSLAALLCARPTIAAVGHGRIRRRGSLLFLSLCVRL
jgi:hypothetical protein